MNGTQSAAMWALAKRDSSVAAADGGCQPIRVTGGCGKAGNVWEQQGVRKQPEGEDFPPTARPSQQYPTLCDPQTTCKASILSAQYPMQIPLQPILLRGRFESLRAEPFQF